VLGDDDFCIIAQGVFDHLQLLERLGIAYEILLGGLVDQPDSLCLALCDLNDRLTFALGTLDNRQLLLFGRFKFERFALNSSYDKSSPVTSINRGLFVSATWGIHTRSKAEW
jgi:hypothetical protein